MSASPSSTSSSAAVSSDTPADISLSFKVFKDDASYPAFAFTVNKTITLSGLSVYDRIKSGIAHVENVYTALPHYFVCGEDTSFVLVDDEMTHTLGPSAPNEHAVYVSGRLHATEMVNCDLKELRTRAFYPLDTIKQKLLLLIQNQLGEAPQAQSEAAQAQSEAAQALTARENVLNEREQALTAREHALNESELALNAREQEVTGRENSMNNIQQQYNDSNNNQLNQIQALVSKYDEDKKKYEEDKQKYEEDKNELGVAVHAARLRGRELDTEREILAREQAKLVREQAALKTAKLKLQQQIKNNRKSTDESDSESRSESESGSGSDEDDDDDDEDEDDSEDAAASGRKRKRAERNGKRSNGKGQPMPKKVRQAWKLQRLEATRREYAEIVGNEPGNRIRNNVEMMKKAIERAKMKAAPRKSGR